MGAVVSPTAVAPGSGRARVEARDAALDNRVFSDNGGISDSGGITWLRQREAGPKTSW